MKHKKYLRKQVEGDESENVSDEKDDEDTLTMGVKYIKKEEDTRQPSSNDEVNNNFNNRRTTRESTGTISTHNNISK